MKTRLAAVGLAIALATGSSLFGADVRETRKAFLRARTAISEGRYREALELYRKVIELLPEDDHLQRGAAMALLGLAAWTSGDLETAYRSYADGMARMLRQAA